MPFMSPTGRHVTAAEALQLGIVDQVTNHNTVDTAVKFALSVAGETQEKNRWHKVHTGIKIKSLFIGFKMCSVEGREISLRAVILGKSDIKKCRRAGCESQRKQKNKTGRSSTTEAINVSWLCQMCSDVFTAFAVLFRRVKRDKLS